MPHRDPAAKRAYMRERYRRKRQELQRYYEEWKQRPGSKAKINAATRAWRARNPEQMDAARQSWSERHPEQRRERVRRRRARMRALPVLANAEVVAQRIAFYGGRCWVCGAEYEEIDHVKPIAAGGAHIGANLRPICGPCNKRKQAQWPYQRRKGA